MVVNRKRQNKNYGLNIQVSFYSFSHFLEVKVSLQKYHIHSLSEPLCRADQSARFPACLALCSDRPRSTTGAQPCRQIARWRAHSQHTNMLMTFFSVREEDTTFVMHRSVSLIKSMKVSVLLSSQDISHLFYYLQRLVCCFNRNINYT